MDYSIRPIGSAPVRSVPPRRERSDQPPFELEDGESGPAPENRAQPEPEPAPADRAVAPPADDEVGSHLDLSA